MNMPKESDDEFLNRLIEGLHLAYQRMVEHKRKHNHKMVILRDGVVVTINPRFLSLGEELIWPC